MAVDYQPVYLLASGMLLQERKLGVVSNNLANVDTPSFKRDLLTALSWFTDGGQKAPTTNPQEPSNNFVYPVIADIGTDFSQGALKFTGNTFDLAIEGEGFFAVNTPQGVAFTRRGDFRLDVNGFLVDVNGYRVLDPAMNEISIDHGEVTIDEEGNIYVDGVLQGSVGIFSLEDPLKEGRDLFTGTPGASTDFKVRQGFLEMSNVNAVEELVRMIDLTRAHEIFSRLIQAVDEIQGRVNTLAV